MPEMCSNSLSVTSSKPIPVSANQSAANASQRGANSSTMQSISNNQSNNPGGNNNTSGGSRANNRMQAEDPNNSRPNSSCSESGSGGSESEDLGFGDEVISYKDEGETFNYAVEELIPHCGVAAVAAVAQDSLQDIKSSLINEHPTVGSPVSAETRHHGSYQTSANLTNNNHLNQGQLDASKFHDSSSSRVQTRAPSDKSDEPGGGGGGRSAADYYGSEAAAAGAKQQQYYQSHPQYTTLSAANSANSGSSTGNNNSSSNSNNPVGGGGGTNSTCSNPPSGNTQHHKQQQLTPNHTVIELSSTQNPAPGSLNHPNSTNSPVGQATQQQVASSVHTQQQQQQLHSSNFAAAQVALTAAMYSQLTGAELPYASAAVAASAADIDPKTGGLRNAFAPAAYTTPSYHDFALAPQWAAAPSPAAGAMMFHAGAAAMHPNAYHHGAGAILPGAHRAAAAAAFPFYLGGMANLSPEEIDKRNKEHAAALVAHQQQQVAEAEHKSYRPYVKKPLNAFMLFMKENREKVMQESTLKESAAINQILGRKWHQLDRTEQAKYYEMARRERAIHLKLYPGWSARDNYAMGKHRKKRKRPQGPTAAHVGMGGQHMGVGVGVGVMPQQAPQLQMPNPGMLAQSMKAEFSDIDKKCRARFGMDQQDAWCKHCRRKKKCQFMIKTEDGFQMTVANPNSGDDSEDQCSESEECLAAERAAQLQQSAVALGYHHPHQQLGQLSPPSLAAAAVASAGQHINVNCQQQNTAGVNSNNSSCATPGAQIPTATDMTINKNNSANSSSSSNLLPGHTSAGGAQLDLGSGQPSGGGSVSPPTTGLNPGNPAVSVHHNQTSQAQAQMAAAQVAAAGVLLAANHSSLLPQNPISTPAHAAAAQQNLAPFFAAAVAVSGQHNGGYPPNSNAAGSQVMGNAAGGLPFSTSSAHHPFATSVAAGSAGLFSQNVHAAASN
ncbi:uncharacterized protein LOC142347900 isoform X2 [Convolutriloba macropyga]|uniref:uncharacterized protein LOC142347900 isoform X2 n=1 Tax=Convolutriloba macropyga TaxID=536237 RepID=UPI003F521534